MHEVKTMLSSLFFDIWRIEMLLLQIWHHVPFALGNWCFFVRERFGPSMSLPSSLFCVGCFASAPRVGAFAWSVVASWLGILDIETACPILFPLRWTISYSKAASFSSQRAVKPSGTSKFWSHCTGMWSVTIWHFLPNNNAWNV